MTEKQPNHLLKENSPYLLQHAYNPVDWHPWGSFALDKAVAENKLLIVSIGYAACHWCHVMEHESFEDPEVAEAMNRSFVAVKVDREERPDIDQVYMTAAYSTTGRGGWPLNVIALPDQRPVFAGTYFPKKDWLYILKYYADLYKSHPGELAIQAEQIAAGMKRHFHLPVPDPEDHFSPELPDDLFNFLIPDLDPDNGGTYGAPKFPMPVMLNFMMVYGKMSGNKQALGHVGLTLDKMHMGGIYDHLGGGFCRYAVDAHWHVPHFEKMLYDNAQLVSLYSSCYQWTKNHEWKSVVEETLGFIDRELTSLQGLFHSSIDADSENREGAFYVWKEDEIRKCLGTNPQLFLTVFNCSDKGNWENGENVLRKSVSDSEFAAARDISADDLNACLQVCSRQLLTVRENRPRPATDDKILTCWNAMMISALVDASLVFGQAKWLEKAIGAAEFYRIHIHERKGKLWRNSKANSLKIPGFLDDYCFLIKAFLDLFQATFNDQWLAVAELLTSEVSEHFSTTDGIFFNLVSAEEPMVVMKSAELSDNVIPASNSAMAHNLFVLGHILGSDGFISRSERMVRAMIPRTSKNPAFHANWAILMSYMLAGPVDIQIVGDRAAEVRKSFAGHDLPGVIWSGSPSLKAAGMKERAVPGKTLIYVCRDKTCFAPVETVDDALQFTNERE